MLLNVSCRKMIPTSPAIYGAWAAYLFNCFTKADNVLKPRKKEQPDKVLKFYQKLVLKPARL